MKRWMKWTLGSVAGVVVVVAGAAAAMALHRAARRFDH